MFKQFGFYQWAILTLICLISASLSIGVSWVLYFIFVVPGYYCGWKTGKNWGKW